MQQQLLGRERLNYDHHHQDINLYIEGDGSQTLWHHFGDKIAVSPNVLLPKTTSNNLISSTMKPNASFGIQDRKQEAEGKPSDRGLNAHNTLSIGLPISDKDCSEEYETSTTTFPLTAHPTYSFPDPQFVNTTPVTGHPMVHPSLQTAHHDRVVLPFVMSEEPVYVNAKQYHGILRRRQLRAKAELENKVTRVRKPYLHESRHLHAMRRARGCGGRFANTKKRDTAANNSTTTDKRNSSKTMSSGSAQDESCTSYDELKRLSNQESRSNNFLQFYSFDHKWLSQ